MLCVDDLLVLYTRCGDEWLTGVIGYSVSWRLMVNYDIVCKALPFAISFAFHLTKWLVVATAIEGVIAAGFPQRSSGNLYAFLTRAGIFRGQDKLVEWPSGNGIGHVNKATVCRPRRGYSNEIGDRCRVNRLGV